jgi:hypothetical protein
MTALILASPTPQFPLDNGGRIRMHRLLTGLATEFDATFVTHERPGGGGPWLVERAHVTIVPVSEGSGTRLKIIEAMTLGRPLLSTQLGADGPADVLSEPICRPMTRPPSRLHLKVARWCYCR